MFDEMFKDPAVKARWDARAPQRALTEALIEARIKKKCSQRKLAKDIGMKQPALARIETGKAPASFATLCRVATGLNKRIEINLVDV